MLFYPGLHQPCDVRHFERAMVSVNRLRRYRRPNRLGFNDWIMDSGAFMELKQYGRYRHEVQEYAAEVRRWLDVGQLQAVVSQDYMCEPLILERTGLTVYCHQLLSVERYLALRLLLGGVYVMPVIQGYTPEEYARHVRMYAARLEPGAWAGVGSVCKRNSDPREIARILWAIHGERPDLRLHGFGLKTTALKSPEIRTLLYSADSMAWSFAARRQGRDRNDHTEAACFAAKVEEPVLDAKIDPQGLLFAE